MAESNLKVAFDRFDTLNAADPRQTDVDGVLQPTELVYALRMSQWLHRLAPDASEPLQLAARSQHLMRWMIPRDSYPQDRAGYLKWRTTLYDFHADRSAEVLHEVGYGDATIARVRSLIRKEQLKTDPDAQALEDVICLVFLDHYFAEFAAGHDEAKLIRILQRTWKKMSPRGQDAALKLNFSPPQRALILKALAGE